MMGSQRCAKKRCAWGASLALADYTSPISKYHQTHTHKHTKQPPGKCCWTHSREHTHPSTGKYIYTNSHTVFCYCFFSWRKGQPPPEYLQSVCFLGMEIFIPNFKFLVSGTIIIYMYHSKVFVNRCQCFVKGVLIH